MDFRNFVAFLLVAGFASGQKLQKLDNLFKETATSNQTLNDIKCSTIEGSLKNCYECYLCDEPIIQYHRDKGDDIQSLRLIENTCDSTEICCVSQNSFRYRSNQRCGIGNYNGYPRKLRTNSRCVLKGEYPWRAWIYQKSDPVKPLCAATFISDDARALITSASCLSGRDPSSLFVVFDSDPEASIRANILHILVHDEFIPETHENDIAILSVSLLPATLRWVKPACLPDGPVPFATSCIAVSDNLNLINIVIPHQAKCAVGSESLHPTLTCAAAPRNDYPPEYGSGLFCLEEQTKTPTYVVYGIALHKSGESLSVYTNVSHFVGWIMEKMKFIFPNDRKNGGYRG